MRNLLPLFFTCFLLFIGSAHATSSFYCEDEDRDNTLTFIITTKSVLIVSDDEESEHKIEVHTTMHNNDLLLEIMDDNETINITLDIKEDDLVHVASLQQESHNKNIDRHSTSLTAPIRHQELMRRSFLRTIYGSVTYKAKEYSVHCVLDNYAVEI